ncbi:MULTISPECIES: GbsR/MarR family transcriptional regulator [unclassified Pseudonocardia]|uniref:GbsR/MarR family transcriptional regulator n=1 Tax=unclassified Pseudonocardia TaxID=2619320 RepID=UPI001CF62C7A|nr:MULTISPECIES: MarR family transcriptional regulator [unclassified Pseudonocardia]
MAESTDPEFVARFTEALTNSGWPRMSARIFATLMATPEGALTAADLSTRLGVGASAISNGAKMLRGLGLVDVARREERRITYVVRPDAWMAAVAHQDHRLQTLEDILTDGADASTDAAAGARLRETADFFAFLRAELPRMVRRWRAGRQAPPPGHHDHDDDRRA